MRYLSSIRHSIVAALLLPVLLFSALSCMSDSFETPEINMREIPKYSFGLEEIEPYTIETRTALTDANIETKKTGITLAAYTGGQLYAKQHYTSSLTAMSLALEKGYTYNVYALVNMGDMTPSIPQSESAIASITYTIPAYTGGSNSVNSLGMPMAGVLENLSVTSSTSGTKTVPVKRLLAKVSVTLNCNWAGAKIASVKACNMNKVLKPFGTSAASGSSDILSFQDITSVSSSSQGPTLSTVLYVPENMQGTVSGISTSMQKRPDGGNSTIANNQGKLSYLEVAVTGTGAYTGSVTYRSYLGNNATTNFDVARNTHYVWTITYQENGLQNDNWKVDNNLSDGRDFVIPGELYMEPYDSYTWPQILFNLSNLTVNDLGFRFYGGNTNSVINNPTSGQMSSSGSFSIKSTATAGQTSTLEAKPTVNPTSELTKTSEIRVINKIVEWVDYDSSIYSSENKKVYTVNPGASVDAPVDFYFTWTGNPNVITHDRGLYGVKWDYTTAPATGITSTAINGSQNSTNDKIRYTVQNTVAPGDYPIQVTRRSPQSGSDQAYLRVNDTRYLRFMDQSQKNLGATGITRYEYTNDGDVHFWIPYGSYFICSNTCFNEANTSPYTINFGDITGEHRLGNVNVTDATIRNYLTFEYDTTIFTQFYAHILDAHTYVQFIPNVNVPAGTHVFKVRFAGEQAGSEHEITAYMHVTDVVENTLTVEPENPTATAGTPINLVAKYHTITNGVDDGGVVVTTNNNTTWSRASGSSQITVGNGGWNGNPKGQVTCPNTIQTAQTATVQATYNGQTASTTVTFNPTVDYVLVVNPSTLSLNVGASSSALTASVYQVVGGQRQGTPVASNVNASWSSSNSGVASVSNGGVVTGVSAGSASITATYTYNGTQLTSSGNDACAVTVSNVVSNWLEVTPSTVTGTAGTPVSLVAKYHTVTNGQDDGGTVVTTSATWTRQSGSNQISVNNSNNKGQVTCPNSITTAQTATVRASYNGQTADASVTFNPDFSYELVINPSTLSVNVGATNTTLRAHVYRLVGGVRENNPIQSNVNASWTSSATSIATVNGSGAVTGVAAGTAYISASYTYNGAQLTTKTNDRCTVTVSNVVSNFLEITPNPAEGTAGTTISLVAKYHTVTNGQDDGGTVVTTSATWSRQSGSSSITVSNSGNAKGQCSCPNTIQSAQTATVQATYNGQTATTSVTFNPTISYVLAITPSSVALNVGATSSALSANVYRVVGGQRESSPVASNVNATWSSSSTSIATVNSSNRTVTGRAAGTAYISASYNYNGTSLTTTGNDRCAVTVSDVVTRVLHVEPSPSDVYIGGTVQLYARLYTYTNGVKGSYVAVNNATWSSSNTSWATVNSSGLVTGVATGTVYISASARVDNVNYSTTNDTRATVNVLADVVTSYDNPVVTLSYSPNPVAYTGGPANPTLTVSQTVHYASGNTSTITTIPSGSTVQYSGSSNGFNLNQSTGVVTASSNEGNTTTSYGNPTVSLSYSPTPLAYTGGTSNPTVSYSQTVTTTRAATSQRSISVSVSVTMNGKTGNASASVTQSRDNGASSSTQITSGALVQYSGSGNGFDLNQSTGVVTASTNEGYPQTNYSAPTVSLSYSPNQLAYTGGAANPTISYSQTVTTTRSTTNSRSIGVTAVVTLNGKTGSGSATVSQNGDSGASSSTTVTTGGQVTYSGSAMGFSVNSTGQVTATSNAGSSSVTYANPVVTLDYPTSPIPYAGGQASPSLSYSQVKTTTRGTTNQRSVNVTASVTLNGTTGTGSATVNQSGDTGGSSQETLTTGGTLYFTRNGNNSVFSIDPGTGLVTATDNLGLEIITYVTPVITLSYNPTSFSETGGTAVPTVSYSQEVRTRRPTTNSRSTTVTARVTMNGKSGTVDKVVSQSGDPGQAEQTTHETTGGTVSFNMASATGFSIDSNSNSATFGNITVAQNTGAARSTTVTASVTKHGMTSQPSNVVQISQSGPSVQYEFYLVPTTANLIPGAQKSFVIYRHTVGSTQNPNTDMQLSASDFTWQSNNTSNVTVSNGVASATNNAQNGQTATITVTLKNTAQDYALYPVKTATAVITIVSPSTPGWDDDWDDQGGIII